MPMSASSNHSPVFTAQEQIMMWQGVQKLINEAEEHRAALLKGFQGAEPDKNSQILNESYGKRIQICRDIQNKMPELAHFTKPDKA